MNLGVCWFLENIPCWDNVDAGNYCQRLSLTEISLTARSDPEHMYKAKTVCAYVIVYNNLLMPNNHGVSLWF